MREIITATSEKLGTRAASVRREMNGSMLDSEIYDSTSWMPHWSVPSRLRNGQAAWPIADGLYTKHLHRFRREQAYMFMREEGVFLRKSGRDRFTVEKADRIRLLF